MTSPIDRVTAFIHHARHNNLHEAAFRAYPNSDGFGALLDDLTELARPAEPAFAEDWSPTAANINALPEPLRRYIHDLETRADPAGEVLENHQLRQQVRAVEAMVERLRKEERSDAELRRAARGVVDATTQDPDGRWIITGDAEVTVCRLADALAAIGGDEQT